MGEMPQPGKMRREWFTGGTENLQLSGHSAGCVAADHLRVEQLRGKFGTLCTVLMVCHLLHLQRMTNDYINYIHRIPLLSTVALLQTLIIHRICMLPKKIFM